MTRPTLRSLATLTAAVVLPALALSGCGGEPKSAGTPSSSPSSSAPPSPSVAVPSGVDLTDPGSRLELGETATVAYQPNEKRGSVLELTVQHLEQGTIEQLSAYVLDKNTRQSTPYYVKVKVANVGEGNVGRTDVPLWVVDQDNTLIHSSSFTNTFQRCPSQPLPRKFGPGKEVKRCLVYLVPHHGKLTGVSFRPMQAVAPIEWHGKVAGPADHGKQQKKGKKKS